MSRREFDTFVRSQLAQRGGSGASLSVFCHRWTSYVHPSVTVRANPVGAFAKTHTEVYRDVKRTTTQYPEQVRLPTTSPTDVATFIQACIRDNMKEVQWQETRVHPQLVKLFNIPGFVLVNTHNRAIVGVSASTAATVGLRMCCDSYRVRLCACVSGPQTGLGYCHPLESCRRRRLWSSTEN